MGTAESTVQIIEDDKTWSEHGYKPMFTDTNPESYWYYCHGCNGDIDDQEFYFVAFTKSKRRGMRVPWRDGVYMYLNSLRPYHTHCEEQMERHKKNPVFLNVKNAKGKVCPQEFRLTPPVVGVITRSDGSTRKYPNCSTRPEVNVAPPRAQ